MNLSCLERDIVRNSPE